ncbi:MAG: hypothetical protein M3P32_02370 [Chloroflexota bacterium]|nr:hypothetical protein [Chloroflexota bacterium]
MSMPGWLRRLGALPLHPFLTAAFPVVYLYAQNVHEAIAAYEVLLPLALGTGFALAALLLFRALTRSWASAALISTMLVVLFFTYGLAWQGIGTMVLGHWVLVAAWALLAVIGITLSWRFGELAARLTTPLNVVGAALLGVNLVIIGAFVLNVRPTVAVTGPGMTMSPTPAPGERLPDIYWIILDRYGSANVVDKYFDYDNSPFLDELRSRGFYVAEHATANYLKTALSLTSSRSMDYLDFTDLRAQATADDDWGPLYRGLSGTFDVEHYLGSAGYRFIYLGTYWGPTARNSAAQINYVYDKLASEFLDVLAGATMLRAFEGLGPEAPFDWRRNRWNQTSYELASLNRASSLAGPKFVHAHFALPHDPYVFHADGSFVSLGEEKERPRIVNYVDQMRFANTQMLAWLDSILAVPEGEQPIVIIQSDEGPFPVRYANNEPAFDWTTATPEELEHKFGILSTFYLPGKSPEEAGLYDSITPVNQFRAIFHAYFGLDLPLLPDRNWIFVDQRHIYTEVDVTDRVAR